MKAKLCKCNNCGTVMIDQNPQTNTPELEVPDNATDMQFIDESEGGYWACPICEDDGYLMDITEESQLPAPSTPVEDKQTEDINCWDCGKPTIGGICNCDKQTESNKLPLYNIIHSPEREMELQDLCKQVLKASPERYYNPNGADQTTCPFCCEKDYSNGCTANIEDIKHEPNCAYYIAKGLLTNIP